MCNRTDCAGVWAGEIACSVCGEGEMAEKVICECCGRQITRTGGDNYTASAIGAVRSIGNTAICGECASDLDENGLFPEEATK